ncbi:MAG: hypothetical protein IAE91_02325 [Ignavibacteriaceae bacterium]|nr:hypothetical protein [Ignavibacteriaceae bacterium]
MAINSRALPVFEGVKYDIVSEAAFNLAEIALRDGLKPSELFENNLVQMDILAEAESLIWKSDNVKQSEININDIEKKEILAISDNILEFIRKMGGEKLKFKPKLKGYSFIPDVKADISIDDKLFEIKTVNRNFRTSDLKQLLIYLALDQVSKENNWQSGGLYNPRKGTYVEFDARKMVYNLSGGNSPNEVLESLLNGFIRDVVIDSKF